MDLSNAANYIDYYDFPDNYPTTCYNYESRTLSMDEISAYMINKNRPIAAMLNPPGGVGTGHALVIYGKITDNGVTTLQVADPWNSLSYEVTYGDLCNGTGSVMMAHHYSGYTWYQSSWDNN